MTAATETTSAATPGHGDGVTAPGEEKLTLSRMLSPKYIALLLLVAQTVGAIITMRLSRLHASSSGFMYLNTTAVVMSEVLKLGGSLVLVWRDCNYSVKATWYQLRTSVIQRPWESLKVGVPAFLYTIQNNLIFIALSNMSPALYQITYQLKILTTAVLSVLILHKVLSGGRWLSLILLTTGVALIQVPTSNTPQRFVGGDFFVGAAAVVAACFTSGFAGVYFEKILKGSPVSIWLRNIQLAVFGIILGLLGVWFNDGAAVASDGFFQGYTHLTWIVIVLQGLGGLIVAAVLKYADNILKCFGNALAIVLSCLLSYKVLKDVDLTPFFFIGATLVIFSTYAYGIDFNPLRLVPYPLRSHASFKWLTAKLEDEERLPFTLSVGGGGGCGAESPDRSPKGSDLENHRTPSASGSSQRGSGDLLESHPLRSRGQPVSVEMTRTSR